MDSLPSELLSFIHALRPLFRAEVFDSFCFLLTGLLVGEAKQGTVRASVFAPAQYQPQRLSDLFCRHKLSHQAFIAALARLALVTLYPSGLPHRLFWFAAPLVLDCRCDHHGKAIRTTHQRRPLVSSDEADRGAHDKAQGTLLPVRRPPLPQRTRAGLGERAVRRTSICQGTQFAVLDRRPRAAVAFAR